MTISLVATESVELTKTKSPALPLAPVEYDRQYIDQLNNVLRLYFNTIDNLAGQLTLSTLGSKFYMPYGAFQDTTTQTLVADTPTPMQFNQTDFANDVSIVSNTKITVAEAGIYNLQWSGEFQNADNQIHDIDVWLRQDGPGAGIDVPGSRGVIACPARKSATPGDEGHNIVGWNYFVSLQAGEFVEIWWSTNNALVTLQANPVKTTPYAAPSTASVVATMTFVSALPA